MKQIYTDGSTALSEARTVSIHQDWMIQSMFRTGDKIKIPDGGFIRIFNLQGQLMSSVSSEEIRIPDLPSGIYIIMTLYGSHRIYITRS
ncbi:MAG: T9SS type A sorting domain-containing protein [Saprospiraceae bacterium]|nr:T9SS type A sorting domain-containing protein [Saprospiraceae bacterium]